MYVIAIDWVTGRSSYVDVQFRRRLNVQSGPRNGEVCFFSPLKSVAPCDQVSCEKRPWEARRVSSRAIQFRDEIGKGSTLGCAHSSTKVLQSLSEWEAEGTKCPLGIPHVSP